MELIDRIKELERELASTKRSLVLMGREERYWRIRCAHVEAGLKAPAPDDLLVVREPAIEPAIEPETKLTYREQSAARKRPAYTCSRCKQPGHNVMRCTVDRDDPERYVA